MELGFLESVVPLLVHLMMENPDAVWGDPCYPVVESTTDKQS